MKKIILVFFILTIFASCKTNNKSEFDSNNNENARIELRFLDDFVYPAKQVFQGTKIGGLSGIDYDNSSYYVVSDDFTKPRYYKANINIQDNKIKNIEFTDVVVFDQQQDYYKNNLLDLESIISQNGNVVISSEGGIVDNKKPSIFISDTQGNYLSEYIIPNLFLNSARDNGVFEALSKSIDNQGIWSATELPLTVDGTEAMHPNTHSPLRFTYYDNNSRKATKEYIYELSPLPFPKKNGSDMNGVSDILEYKKNCFLVVERAFQGRNTIRIFKATVEDSTTNSININSLQNADYVPMKKELLFDFESVESELIKQRIDNIEGITFGETLPNGNRSIIVIADDNFQKFGLQLNQFILLEVVEKQ